MERIIYAECGTHTALAVVENGRLCEYLPEAPLGEGLAETIYKGRVERVVPGMRAAFVQLGLEKNGFLPLEENSKTVSWPALQSGQDVTPRLRKLVDTVSVSLNAATAEDYDRLCRPAFGPAAFPGLMDFARRCQAQGIQTVLSVVDVIGPEKVAACRALAKEAGIPLRVRAYIP